jgi:hypothetical protein
MNKTLLLIICDFLLLNLLALTRWEKAEPQRASLSAATPKATAAASLPAVSADMVELMRVSLEDEKTARAQLADQLTSTKGTLEQREQNLALLQQQKGTLERSLAATQADARALEQKFTASSQEAALSKEQLAKMQRELEERRAEAARQQEALAKLERQNTEARQRIEGLSANLGAAQQENKLLTGSLSEAKQQIVTEREERAKVQAQTVQLVQGVGQLTEKSGELTREIRDNRPINPNVLFSEFLPSRVDVKLATRRPGLFGPAAKERETKTVLLTDGTHVYALLHLTDTPFSLTDIPQDFDLIAGRLAHGSFSAPVRELRFLALDPRLLVVPVDGPQAALMGVKIHNLAAAPFKFPEAVLVRADDGKYGETPFRIDAQNPGFVKVDNRIVTRLFGEFAPRKGDLMFSKTGDLIGIMVNNDYCAVLGNFSAGQTLKAGEDVTQSKTSTVFAALVSRWQGLPLRLQ